MGNYPNNEEMRATRMAWACVDARQLAAFLNLYGAFGLRWDLVDEVEMWEEGTGGVVNLLQSVLSEVDFESLDAWAQAWATRPHEHAFEARLTRPRSGMLPPRMRRGAGGLAVELVTATSSTVVRIALAEAAIDHFQVEVDFRRVSFSAAAHAVGSLGEPTVAEGYSPAIVAAATTWSQADEPHRCRVQGVRAGLGLAGAVGVRGCGRYIRDGGDGVSGG